ncbi:metal-dependent hydrolase [Halorussus sp. MSC15.2]|uniref:metal-dependent hydrolase n=1 Tax=Halorussus sp. MSC15.2 TaxID=2283638 RepID=UPI0013D38848|nr:metal-dependent hydrolase [Halorussus sp. MSC15.2]NEU57995.1 metal-dependent hydrolase [Halorussus sp. MSC15.2]
MMATTHALFGVVLASAAAGVAPEFAPVALATGVFGSVFPDLDLYAGHRRTLHFPVYYAVAALAAVGLAVLVPVAATVALAVFLVGAAAHSVMDAFGGGLELKPWLAESERAVYDHYRGRWVAPRRWIRYDGAPEDFLLAVVFGAPMLVAYDGPVRAFVAALLLVSAGYALARKHLASLAEHLVRYVPSGVRPHLPERFRDGSDPTPPAESGD